MNALEFVLGFVALAVIWFFFGLIGLVVLAIIIAVLYAIPTVDKEKKGIRKLNAEIDKKLAEGYILDIKTGKWEKPD
jgi:ABC-type multidrug transport system fused ATPase/permease subunit